MIMPRETRTKPSKAHRKGIVTYEVEFTDNYGKRKRRYFQLKTEAQDLCDRLNNETRRAACAPEDLKLEAIRCQEKLAGRMTLTEAVDFAVKHAANFTSAPIISQLVEQYIEHKQHRAKSTLKEIRLKLRDFAEAFGQRRLHEITQSDISEWAAELRTDDMERITLDKYLAKTSEFYNFYKGEFCDHNPVIKVRERLDIGEQDKYKEVEFFTPAECRKILDTADTIGFRWYVVLGIYCGIRPTELERLRGTHVHVTHDELIVLLGADVTKIKRRRVLELHRGDALADCVLDWLDSQPVPDRLINGGGRGKKEQLKACIGRWIDDGLRHSAATYHVAQFKNPGATCYLLGHEKPGMLATHYRGLATEAQAREFYGFRPHPTVV